MATFTDTAPMPEIAPGLRIPASSPARNADQRSAFGNFCVNAASFPLPSAIEHRTTQGHRVYLIRRKFFGLASPIINALVEPAAAGTDGDIWRIAEAVLPILSDPEPPHLVKLFLAGSVRDRAAEVGRIGAGDSTYGGVFQPVDVPESIELTDSYETFLRTLGNHTRRDMRRLRRRAVEAGMVFEFRPAAMAGIAERHALARATHPEPYQPRQIDAYDTFLAAQEHGYHALLRSRSGELVSCVAGLISDQAAIVLYQLNHRRYAKASLSLTNRSYAIEHLIQQGVREFVLPGGGAGLLVHASRLRRSGELALIQRSATPVLKSLMVTLLSPSSSVAYAVRRLARSWVSS